MAKYLAKVICGKRKIDLKIQETDGVCCLSFPFNRDLINEVKGSFEGPSTHGFGNPQWRPEKKVWQIKALSESQRNRFILDFLMGKNPYERYDKPLVNRVYTRTLYDHQKEMADFVLTRRHAIIAGDMGTGKTLAAIEIMERFGLEMLGRYVTPEECWYMGPKSGLYAVRREMIKWNCAVRPTMFTYEGLTSEVNTWTAGKAAPRILILDESSKIKTCTSQRSKAAYHVAKSMREEWGDECIILAMSGTPAPKDPTDWWHQCEVACPGFLKENTVTRLKYNLCLVQQIKGITGTFPKIITWLDDENKCTVCGQFPESEAHASKDFFETVSEEGAFHDYKKSVNEVRRLYERMRGLVLVKRKADCLDLPEIIYERLYVKPTVSMLRTANTILKTTSGAAQALTLIRELSDGFLYEDIVTGYIDPCPRCGGSGEEPGKKQLTEIDMPTVDLTQEDFEDDEVVCRSCKGTGKKPIIERQAKSVGSPKDEALKSLLEEYEEEGRMIVWGGFQGTIDRLVEMCRSAGWDVIRVDGRGWAVFSDWPEANVDLFMSALDRSDKDFERLKAEYPKIVFVGQPGAGGMGITLTGASIMIYYSNSFSGEARSQSRDRFHRAGMDKNLSPKLIDIICLNTDELVIDNLDTKRKLETMTMGELHDALETAGNRDRRYFQ